MHLGVYKWLTYERQAEHKNQHHTYLLLSLSHAMGVALWRVAGWLRWPRWPPRRSPLCALRLPSLILRPTTARIHESKSVHSKKTRLVASRLVSRAKCAHASRFDLQPRTAEPSGVLMLLRRSEKEKNNNNFVSVNVRISAAKIGCYVLSVGKHPLTEKLA